MVLNFQMVNGRPPRPVLGHVARPEEPSCEPDDPERRRRRVGEREHRRALAVGAGPVATRRQEHLERPGLQPLGAELLGRPGRVRGDGFERKVEPLGPLPERPRADERPARRDGPGRHARDAPQLPRRPQRDDVVVAAEAAVVKGRELGRRRHAL